MNTLPPNTADDIMALMDPTIEAAFPQAQQKHRIIRLLSFSSSDKSDPKNQIESIITAQLNDLVEHFNSPQGQHFLNLMQEYITRSLKEKPASEKRLVSSKTIDPDMPLQEALTLKDSSGATLGGYFRHLTGYESSTDSPTMPSPKM